ncbi:MAG: aspartate aminotransferase family protein [SAR202 cluster bacterium]|nr:aspartate aminotransferase family protein [SAR202 cluster bacterium]
MPTPIEKRYIDLHPKSAALHAQSQKIFPNGVTHETRRLSPFPYFITHAEGAYKWDVDGHKIIDFRTGHGSMILGHSHPDVVKAVTEQMMKGTHYSGSTDLEIRWGQLVKDLVPCAEKVRFTNSGTEATMMAFRICRAFTGKSKIIKFNEHFHGWHDYAVADTKNLTGIPKGTLASMVVLEANDIALVEKTLREDKDIAAIILEPTGAHMGEEPIIPSFLKELRDVTKKYGVILIFDEVVTGFRISRGGASAHYGVTPDMTTLAKILGGGLPGGAVAGKAEILEMIEAKGNPDHDRNRMLHTGTFNGNPLSAAAGVTALNLVKTTPVNEKANAAAARWKKGVNEILRKMEIPGCANGVASTAFVRYGVAHECDHEICVLTHEQMAAAKNPARNSQIGLALFNNGVDTSSRYLFSQAHTDEVIDKSLEIFEKSLREVRAQGLV